MAPFLIVVCLLWMFPLFSKDLGRFGTVFAIQEDDFLEVLSQRLTQVSDIEKEKLKMMQHEFITSIQEPQGQHIPKATQYRAFLHDPTIHVKEDIRDHKDKIIVKKGFAYNPLEKVKLTADLLFFDATDPKQLAWAKSTKGKWILTNGKPIDLEEIEGKSVYFDQRGFLSHKLNIESLPAKVSQAGPFLQVEEIPCL